MRLEKLFKTRKKAIAGRLKKSRDTNNDIEITMPIRKLSSSSTTTTITTSVRSEEREEAEAVTS